MMRALQASHRLTYIVISHDLAVLKFLSDRIGVMYLGKLVEIGAAKDIYEHAGPPLHGRPHRHDPRAEPRAREQPAGAITSKVSCLRR